jgi:hypothetical protein
MTAYNIELISKNACLTFRKVLIKKNHLTMNYLQEHSQWITFFAGLMTAIISGKALTSTEESGLSKRMLAILTLICGILTAFGSLMTNEDSNEKSEKLTIKSDSIKTLSQNNSYKLDSSLGKLNHIVEESAQVLGRLKQERILLFQQSKKMENIYELSNKIKYPLPDFVEVSYDVLFQLEEVYQKKVDSIVFEKQLSRENEDTYFQVDFELFKVQLGWDLVSNKQRVDFCKKIDFTPNNVTWIGNILSLDNNRISDGSLGANSNLLYNPHQKRFLIIVKKIRLDSKIVNYNALPSTSIFDLEGSTMTLHQLLPERCISREIKFLEISSKELNLVFWKLEKTLNIHTFSCRVDKLK